MGTPDLELLFGWQVRGRSASILSQRHPQNQLPGYWPLGLSMSPLPVIGRWSPRHLPPIDMPFPSAVNR